MKTKIGLLILALFITSVTVFSQKSSYHQVGVSLKASNNGIGGDVYYRPFKTLAVKVGYEVMNINITAEDIKPYAGDVASISIPMPTGGNMGFDLGTSFKAGSLSAALGYQPFGGLYFTAGIGTFLLDAMVSGTPTTNLSFVSQNVPGIGVVSPTVSKDKIGNFGIQLKPTKTIAPYFGIGLGSFVPRNKRLSFALELGAYYMGAPQLSVKYPTGLVVGNIDYGVAISDAQKALYFGDVDTKVNGFLNDIKSEVNASVDDMNEIIKPFSFYPVLKMTIGIRVL